MRDGVKNGRGMLHLFHGAAAGVCRYAGKRVCLFLPLLIPSVCLAWSWNGYEFPTGGEYRIFRKGSLDVCMGKAGGTILLFPRDYENVGPVVEYYHGEKYIFTRHSGRKDLVLADGTLTEEPDASREFYFIINKENDSVAGPLSLFEFKWRPEADAAGPVQWCRSRTSGDIASLACFSLAMLCLVLKSGVVSLPVVVMAVLTSLLFIPNKKKKPVSG